VDVFYLTDRDGAKLVSPTKLKALQSKLVRAADEPRRTRLEAA
jgi:hypothetical protein